MPNPPVKNERKVPSKQFSCSELKDGHAKLMAVKMESISKDQLEDEIQELYYA